jgi:hypothetical protein
MLRRTMSLSLYLQIVGRGLRPMQGKDRCLILDHVGNQKLHGHPLMTREWTLEGMQKRKRKDTDEQIDNEYKDCTECFRTYEKTHVACPYCGFVEPIKVSEIEQVAGVAVKDETTLDELLKVKRSEQAKSRTLEDLWQLKIQRGHKDKWVYFVFESRVLKESGTVEYINNKHGLNAINRDDLKAAILRKWNEFYKTKKH